MEKKNAIRVVTVVVLVGCLVVLGARVLVRRVDLGISEAVQHKSVKTTSATVVSVKRAQLEEKRADIIILCFKIDNFDDIESEMRRGYEAAEASRFLRDGPRCRKTGRVGIAAHISTGDRLDVRYLLENNYNIDIVSVSENGNQL